MPDVSDACVKLLWRLPAHEVTIEAIKQLMALTENQFRAFSSLLEGQNTLKVLEEVSKLDLTYPQAAVFSCFSKYCRTFDALVEVAQIDGLTESEALAVAKFPEDLREPYFLDQIRGMLRDVHIDILNKFPENGINFRDFETLLSLDQDQVRVFNFFSEIVGVYKDFDLASALIKGQASIFLSLGRAEIFLRLRKNAQTTDVAVKLTRLTVHYINALNILPYSDLTVVVLDKFFALSEEHALAFSFLSSGVRNMKDLGVVLRLKLTNSQDAAFSWLREDFRGLDTLVKVAAITDLKDSHVFALSGVEEGSITLQVIGEISKIKLTQAHMKVLYHIWSSSVIPKGSVIASLKIVATLKKSHINIIMGLPEGALTFDDLKMVAALTEEQAIAFSRLLEDIKTPEFLVKMSGVVLTEEHIKVLGVLPNIDLTFEALEVVADLTRHKAKAFYLLVAKDQTLANLANMPNGLGYVHLVNLLTLKEGKRTISALNGMVESNAAQAAQSRNTEGFAHAEDSEPVASSEAAIAVDLSKGEVPAAAVDDRSGLSIPSTSQIDDVANRAGASNTMTAPANGQLSEDSQPQAITDSKSEGHVAQDDKGVSILDIASSVMLAAGVNSLIKSDVVPVLDNLMPANISQSCDRLIYNSVVHSAPVLSGGLVNMAGYFSLSVPVSVATMYVSHAGLPYDMSSMMQAGNKLIMPLLASKVITAALSLCGTVHPHAKAAITVGTLGASFLMRDESDNSNKDFYDVVSNIIFDNSDPLSVATLTYMTITGLGVVTATVPALAVSAVAGVVISSAYTAYN